MILRVTIKPLLHTATGSSALDSSYPLTFPRNRLASTLPSGAHPDKSEWFHCTRIHTIVDERLGISENKAMKLLISTFFTLLLIGFAGGAYSNPPYSGTVWVDLDIITAADPSAFIQIVSIESGPRIMLIEELIMEMVTGSLLTRGFFKRLIQTVMQLKFKSIRNSIQVKRL